MGNVRLLKYLEIICSYHINVNQCSCALIHVLHPIRTPDLPTSNHFRCIKKVNYSLKTTIQQIRIIILKKY